MVVFDKRVWAVLALVGALVCAANGCQKAASEEASEEDSLPRDPVPVRAAKVEKTVLRPSIDVVGTLIAVPERTASVSPQTAGWIEKVLVVEGGRVRAGEELFRLDSRMAEAEHARAAAAVAEKAAILERLQHGPRREEIEAARHDAHKAQVTLSALRSEVDALKTLQSRNEVSPVQFQKAQSSLQAAEADAAAAAARWKLLEAGTRPEEVAEAQARLEAAKAELAMARLQVQLCRIASPIDGIVTQLNVRQGAYVERTTTLATIVDLSKVFMQIRIPSAYLARVKPGARVDVRVASLPETAFEGKIARIAGQADPATGDVDALAEVANETGLLRPGLACRGRVWLPEIADALVVPAHAIADRAGTPVVTVVREGKGYEVEVKLGEQTADKTQVLEGLEAGDTVVTEGGYGLPDGCPICLVEANERSGTEPKH